MQAQRAEIPGTAGAEKHRRLNTATAAAYLGLSEYTLEAWRVRGVGPTFMKLGRSVLYDLQDLDQFLEQSKRRSTSDTGQQAA